MKTFTPSPTFVNAVINHPAVRPTVQVGLERLYSEDLILNRVNEAVAFDGGVAIFVYQGHGTYDGHIFTLPGSRGKPAIAFGRKAISRLFDRPGAHRLQAAVPLQLPAARQYCRRVGLRATGKDLFEEFFEVEASQWAV